MPGSGRVRRGLRRLRGRVQHLADPPGVILLYHRVACPEVDPWGISVRPEHFAQHLEVLRRLARPAALARLGQDAGAGRRRGGLVAVTFDDGYADNLHAALPLLARHEVPATVFVASGYLGQPGPFWWDELAQLILRSPVLPERWRLENPDQEWRLGRAAQGPVSPAWRAETAADPGPRGRLYLDLYWRLRTLSGPDREALLSAVRAWVGASPPAEGPGAPDPHNRPLTPAELERLAAHPLVEIGAHTVTHPPLAELGPAAQRAEIQASKTRLEGLLQRPVTSFSLPYGSRSDQTLELVRQAGFVRACTSVSRGVRRGDQALALPRFSVADWNGQEFAARLGHWLGRSLAR
ncbi:polysaccharide deacetylase family protein [Deinococcus budaensis]|uniref:Peptidoglycan/xylan/chitin deacetylase (PgdA/CDA1 family) n=1 Tax=Deinococcus budaensis TaxID=1665626 RepID=A0A7W8GC57_9DEIO|nr:peptidoglycan/xylan/chitin deacetylase (PgdA/CDA1 family) [Deinococcus budaensis]